MPVWSFVLAPPRLRSEQYEAPLQPRADGGFNVLTVRARTDTPELARIADNLGEPLTKQLAQSATAFLTAYFAERAKA
jgi:hypothetical protein